MRELWRVVVCKKASRPIQDRITEKPFPRGKLVVRRKKLCRALFLRAIEPKVGVLLDAQLVFAVAGGATRQNTVRCVEPKVAFGSVTHNHPPKHKSVQAGLALVRWPSAPLRWGQERFDIRSRGGKHSRGMEAQ
jgi:hypothetical protein